MKFDVKKFLICFCCIFVINCIHIQKVQANPAVVAPVVTEGLGELLLIIAGICGIQFQTQNDVNAFNERFINQYKDNSGDLLIEQNDLGLWQLTPEGEKELKKENEHIKQISGDYLKSWCSDFKTVVNGLVDCGDLRIAYDYSGDTSLYDVMKKYDLPSLDSFSGQPGASECKINSSISEYINTDNFCYLLRRQNSFALKITSCKGSNVPIINSTNGNDSLCYAGNGYMFSYTVGNGSNVWERSSWAQKDSFYIYDGDVILSDSLIWTNKNILDLSGNKVKDSDVTGVVSGATVGDTPINLPAEDNVFNLDLDKLNTIINGKANENVLGNVKVPDISIGATGDIVYNPAYDQPIDNRIVANPTADYPLDVPTVDPDVVDVPVVDNPGLFDWFSNFWNNLLNLLKNIASYLVGLLTNAFKVFFVPDLTAFNSQVAILKNKFNFVNSFLEFGNVLISYDYGTEKPRFCITYYGVTQDIINFDLYDKYRDKIHSIIIAIAYFLFIKRTLKRLGSVLGGVGQ